MYTFHKSPGWKNQKYMNGHFSAKNIRFKIRKINNRLSPTNGVHSLCIIIPMPRFIGWWFGCFIRNIKQHFHHLSKTGVGQNTFETRKMRDLWLTSHNFFRPTDFFVTVIFWPPGASTHSGLFSLPCLYAPRHLGNISITRPSAIHPSIRTEAPKCYITVIRVTWKHITELFIKPIFFRQSINGYVPRTPNVKIWFTVSSPVFRGVRA